MTVNHATGEIIEPLTAMERSALTHAEAAIEQGADQVAKALVAIRDQRLYRDQFGTFEAYCRERWGMTHRHANRQIVAAEVAAAVGPMGPIPERQARELAVLRDEPERMREVYQQANEATNGKVTAAAIREAVEDRPPIDRVAPRRALADQFFDAVFDLTKVVERVDRLVNDDRFPQNAEKVSAKHRADLLRAVELLSRALDRLN